MKKIVSLILILLTVICMMGSVYAATSCNISVQTAKTEYSKNEQFTVDVNIANIKSDRGIISLGATLDYDKNSLTLVKIEGKNGWETPSSGSSYNEANGKIAIARNGLGKNNETIFTITFKVKEQSKPNVSITLKDITVADGIAPVKIATTYKNITIKETTTNSGSQSGTNNGTTSTPGTTTNGGTSTSTNKTNSQANTSTNKNTKNSSKSAAKTGKLPKAGDTNMLLIISIALVLVVSIACFIRMKVINKKLSK